MMVGMNRYNNVSANSDQMLSAGEIFTRRRIGLRKTIAQVCDDTKIQKKYIEMLEKNDYDSFESEIFMYGFIKIYCKYLGLNVDKIIALTRRTIKEKKKDTVVTIKKEQQRVNISPKFVATIVLTLFVVAVVMFFFYQLYNFQQIPNLVVSSPEENSVVNEEKVIVKGFTDENVILLINGVNVEVKEDGSFETEVDLIEGTNTISVQAVREGNKSKENVKVISVSYEIEEEEIEKVEEIEVPIQNEMKIQIIGGDAWIQLLIDGSQLIGNTVVDGFSETYTVNKDFQVISGRSNITRVFLNNSTDPLTWSISDGVGSINCRLVNNSFSCDN